MQTNSKKGTELHQVYVREIVMTLLSLVLRGQPTLVSHTQLL